MKVRTVAALALVAVLGIFVTSAGGGTQRSAASITVWLQNDAQNGWPDLVASVNQQFSKQHPGVDVNVQYQTWPTHLQKFDATLAGGNAPDVIEMGTTEMVKYMAGGAFQELTAQRGSFDNSANWLKALKDSATYGGRLYGVPYYAGARVVTYRTDLFKKAGIAKLPSSLAQYTADAKKLASKNPGKSFSPLYIAGQDWYVGLGFVYDYGGQIAKPFRGQWQGTLDRPKAIAGLTAFKKFFDAVSKGSKSTIETKPWPFDVYAQGQAASIVGSSWFSCCVGDKYKGVTSQFVMPSHEKGKPFTSFVGGSDLAVPIGANKALAIDWIQAFTDTASQKALQAKGNIPNATNLLGNSVNERAAVRGWTTPTAKNWANVENGNILRNMLTQILTGKLTVKQAASSASDNITSVLNAD